MEWERNKDDSRKLRSGVLAPIYTGCRKAMLGWLYTTSIIPCRAAYERPSKYANPGSMSKAPLED